MERLRVYGQNAGRNDFLVRPYQSLLLQHIEQADGFSCGPHDKDIRRRIVDQLHDLGQAKPDLLGYILAYAVYESVQVARQACLLESVPRAYSVVRS